MRMNTQRILAALLSLVLLLALAPAGWADGEEGGGETQEVQSCFVKIIPSGNNDMMEDLKTANIVVDVYKVANMIKSDKYDTYTFKATTAFAGADDGSFEALVNDIQGRLDDTGIDKKAWGLLAEGSLKAVMADPQRKIFTYNTYYANADGIVNLVDSSGNRIEQGLYLVVAHTDGLEDYLRTGTAEDFYYDINDDLVTEESVRRASIAQTKMYEYYFGAQLIAIPTKAPDENGVIKTSNPGPWLFGTEADPLTYVLKPSRTLRNGILKITKTLTDYADLSKGAYFEPATFSFSIVGKDDEGNIVYQREVSLSVTEPVEEAEVITLNDLIIGTNVTVTESYSGAHYLADQDTVTQTVTIKTPEKTTNTEGVATITGDELHFKNHNDDVHRGGHGIENKFVFSKSSGWQWVVDGVPQEAGAEVVK